MATRPTMRLERRALVLALVLLAHLGLLGLLARAWRAPPVPPRDEGRVTRLVLLRLPSPKPAATPTPPAPRSERMRPATPMPRPADAPAPARVIVPETAPAPVAAAPAERPASTPIEPLLGSEATRRALREAARGPLLSERADQASQTPDRGDAPARLGQSIQKAGHGDCGKGEFAGGGMGLLSLPFYVLAEARGKCRR